MAPTNFSFLSSSIAFLCNLLVAFFVLFSHPSRKINQLFSLLIFAGSLGILSDFFYLFNFVNAENAGPLFRFIYAFAIFSPPLVLHFASELTGSKLKPRFLFFAYCVAGFFSFLDLTGSPLFLRSVSLDVGRSLVLQPGPGFQGFSVFFGFLVFVALLIVGYQYFKEEVGPKRVQLFYYIFASFALFSASAIYFLAPNWLAVCRPDNFFLLAYASIIGLSITKEHLFDISVVVKKVTSYVIVLVLALFSFVLFFEISNQNRLIQEVLVVSLGLFWIVFAPILNNFLVTTARRQFIKNWYNQEAVINEFSKKLAPVYARDDAFRILAEIIDETLELKFASSFSIAGSSDGNQTWYQSAQFTNLTLSSEQPFIQFLKTTESGMYKKDQFRGFIATEDELIQLSDAEFVLPIRYKTSLEGFLVLGAKDAGGGYSARDLQMVDTLTIQFSMILDRFVTYESIKQELEEAKQFIEKAEEQMAFANLSKGIAHEIRNPMAMIRSSFELLQLSLNNPEKVAKYVDRIFISIDRLVAFTDQVLKQGKIGISNIQPTSIKTEIEGIVLLCRGGESENPIQLMTEIPGDPIVPVDVTAFQQMIINLIRNAQEAVGNTDQNRVIRISGKTGTFTQEFVPVPAYVVSIEDNGPGIMPEHRDKIFDAYFTTKHESHGLGLSTVMTLMQAHRGYMEVDSDAVKKRGCIVRLYFPLKPATA